MDGKSKDELPKLEVLKDDKREEEVPESKEAGAGAAVAPAVAVAAVASAPKEEGK